MTGTTKHSSGVAGLRHRTQMMSLGLSFSPFLGSAFSGVGFIHPQALQRPPASAITSGFYFRVSNWLLCLQLHVLPDFRIKWEKSTCLSPTNPRSHGCISFAMAGSGDPSLNQSLCFSPFPHAVCEKGLANLIGQVRIMCSRPGAESGASQRSVAERRK